MFEGFRKLFTAEDWMPARRVLQRDADWWNKLRNDCSLRFGFMAQKDLSGKKLDIGENTLYQFGSGRFISHQLSEEGRPVCQMIVASAGHNQVYLAISRLLGTRDIINLFAEDEFAALPDLSRFTKLYVREHTPGVKDWVTMQYHRRIDGVRGQKTTTAGTRTFSYFLFVSEANDKALEIEWFDDGEYEVYATVYRPVSDIVQVNHERRAQPRVSAAAQATGQGPRLQASEPQGPSAEIISLAEVKKEAEPAVAELADAWTEEEVPSEEMAPEEAVEETTISRLPSVEAEDLPSVATFTPRDLRSQAVGDDASLTCNIRVAAKIIDEALRNDMQLVDIVRRVLGLPVAISESINFHLPLTEQDYRTLADRYGVSPQDREAIREYIIEDLIDFTGEREAMERPRRASHG